MKTPGTVPMTGISSQVSLRTSLESIWLDVLVAELHSAGEDRNLVRFRKDACGVYLGQLVSCCLRSLRQSSVLVSEVGQPELGFRFHRFTGTATLARRVIQRLLDGSWMLSNRHKRECVRSAWLRSEYLNVSEMVFALRKDE